MTSLLLIGIAVQDFVFGVHALPQTAEKHRAHHLAVVGGGLAANAAVAVARLGGHARLLTRLGDDGVGRDIRMGLEREGVDCSMTRVVPNRRSPLSAILVDDAGERLVVSYSDPDMPEDTGWLPSRLPPEMDGVLADSRWQDGSLHILKLARDAGVPGVVDLDRGLGGTALLQAGTHIVMSHQAIRELAHTDDLPVGLASLGQLTSSWLAVTDGPRGVYFQENGRIAHMPAFQVQAVDTLGAGDVFHGAFALAVSEKQDLRAALRFASATAAIKCTRFGGRAGTPSRAEVNAFLAGA